MATLEVVLCPSRLWARDEKEGKKNEEPDGDWQIAKVFVKEID